ncbi:unnamed protein product [Diatraea saccharalis]|uniref:Alkaline phosphatase n=1 Tax=Diatraea saccharalis TaxID=40085 RepID=A0A9N9R2H5_9NEOP|nr:unnamed protein product [Diatraea saccharalis]
MNSVFVVLSVLFLSTSWSLRTDNQFWKDLAKKELEEALHTKWNLNAAKNVIIFVGDGMGPNTVTATRMYMGGESHRLSYEQFPHMGLLKTYSADKMVPDSACSATALFSGVKINKDTIGVDASVKRGDCERSLLPETRLKSLAAEAIDAGKSAGFVTTMRVTHATPGPLYAHSADRLWECDAFMPAGTENCKDIARQLVEDEPGRNFNVILGGGRNGFIPSEAVNAWACARNDSRNLIEDYEKDKKERGLKYRIVSNKTELGNFDPDNTDYLLGIFADGHLSYEYQRNQTDIPSLSEMVAAAIKVLQKNDNGFFLMVEGGNIDMAHHRGWAKVAIDESAAMEEAVKVALAMIDEKNTLFIVTSDHTHTLSINGYPKRGSNIFGIAEASSYDGINYTTLSYSTGGPDSFHFYVHTDENNETTVRRRDPSTEDTDHMLYNQIAGIKLIENSHGGGDVTIYAKGPHAHLFHNVHEQHYVYHAVMYAMTYSNGCAQFASVTMLTVIFLINVILTF